MSDDTYYEVGKRLRDFVYNDDTNLGDNPYRYLHRSAIYAGQPPKSLDAWGGVDPELPHLVYIDKEQPYDEFLKTLSHEGFHSKDEILGHLKDLPLSFKDNIDFILATNPEFLREYLGHKSDTRRYEDLT